jgi:hypothetical protein
MKNHKSLLHVITRASGSAGGDRHEAPAGTGRSRATPWIIAPAIALGSLGAVAAASPGHAIGSDIHASAHQPADTTAQRPHADSTKSCTTDNPWMYGPLRDPWMYAPFRNPWMYQPVHNPWMYSSIDDPWMYTPMTSASSKITCLAASIPAAKTAKAAHSQKA